VIILKSKKVPWKVKKIWPEQEITSWKEFNDILDRKQAILEILADRPSTETSGERKCLNQMIELAFHMARKLTDGDKVIIYEKLNARHRVGLGTSVEKGRAISAFKEGCTWLRQYIKEKKVFDGCDDN